MLCSHRGSECSRFVAEKLPEAIKMKLLFDERYSCLDQVPEQHFYEFMKEAIDTVVDI